MSVITTLSGSIETYRMRSATKRRQGLPAVSMPSAASMLGKFRPLVLARAPGLLGTVQLRPHPGVIQ
jgi:hypothetical protein